ncbi:MAG: 2Fe-2S iron-sulfur cluster-binding protein [Bacteroidota bacterium]
MTITIDGETTAVQTNPQLPLIFFLLDELKSDEVAYHCTNKSCNACTVYINGLPFRSCALPIYTFWGKQVTTNRPLPEKGALFMLLKTWAKGNIEECPKCQPALILAARKLLKTHLNPSDELIRQTLQSSCSCGTAQKVIEAVQYAVRLRPQISSK